MKVARSLERRWHHIWLRSLEWQCLLEQWIQVSILTHAFTIHLSRIFSLQLFTSFCLFFSTSCFTFNVQPSSHHQDNNDDHQNIYDHHQDDNDDHQQGGHPDDSVFDTDDEPLSKVEQKKLFCCNILEDGDR